MTAFDRSRHPFIADLVDAVSRWPPRELGLPIQSGDVEPDVEAERAALYQAASGKNEARAMLACLSAECFTGGHRRLRERLARGPLDTGHVLAAWICTIPRPARDDIAEALFPEELGEEWIDIPIPEIEARLTAARLIRYRRAEVPDGR